MPLTTTTFTGPAIAPRPWAATWRRLRSVGLSAAVTAVACSAWGVALADEKLEIDRVILKVMEEVRIPFQDEGVVQELTVREGAMIQRGQRLGKVDDVDAKLAVARAESDLRLAQHVAANKLPVSLAEKAVDQASQAVTEGQALYDVAAQTARDDTPIRAAVKAHGVAANELQRHLAAKERSDQSVSESKIEALQLMADKALLEAEHARQENDINGLRAKAQGEAVKRLDLAIDKAKLDVQNAASGMEESQLEADLKRRDLEIAQHRLNRRQLVSPVDGIVVEVMHRVGEWVQPGEAILRVLQINRLRAEGFVLADRPIPGLLGASALVKIPQSTGAQIERRGKVVFVNPEVDPVNNQRRIWIEFDNADLVLLPGMLGTATVELPGN
ncbi:HlyD family secretion protein [Planctomyces sp. SH-PL14]|uniref:HlyD family secretion protein n=1 Tax=Planctomyces sp. SH-PL14 TaxID=1632864 RepID=UPI00078D4A4B|nr:efflux RND transporter periplasmic adaptor subunit [Planctomyces sp. SH-PL14]AMV20499.1 putative efflux pump membrane fusion protein [Planctomyces sp. SH-PL14]